MAYHSCRVVAKRSGVRLEKTQIRGNREVRAAFLELTKKFPRASRVAGLCLKSALVRNLVMESGWCPGVWVRMYLFKMKARYSCLKSCGCLKSIARCHGRKTAAEIASARTKYLAGIFPLSDMSWSIRITARGVRARKDRVRMPRANVMLESRIKRRFVLAFR